MSSPDRTAGSRDGRSPWEYRPERSEPLQTEPTARKMLIPSAAHGRCAGVISCSDASRRATPALHALAEWGATSSSAFFSTVRLGSVGGDLSSRAAATRAARLGDVRLQSDRCVLAKP